MFSDTGRPVHSLGDFGRAVPENTRVLLFLPAAAESGRPRVHVPHPQGLLLQEVTAGGRSRKVGGLLADTWPAWEHRCGVDGVETRLRSHGFTG